MTPQLMQAIKLLQLSNLDLAAYVEGELERNPLLERDSEADGPGEPASPQAEAVPEGDAEAGDWMGTDLETSRTAMEEQLGTGLDNVFPEDSGQTTPRAGTRGAARPHPNGRAPVPVALNMATTISRPSFPPRRTLADHLAEQLSIAVTDPARRMIGQYLIDMVDEAGYLAGDLQAVARSSARPWPRWKPCSPSCRASIRPASARAISTNVSRSSSGNATASIPRCATLVEHLPTAGQAPARCIEARSAASTTRIWPT